MSRKSFPKKWNVEVEHVIKEDEGIVISIVRGCRGLALKRIKETIPNSVGMNIFFSRDYELSDEYKGVARLHPGDEFDINYGITEADYIVKKKIRSAISRKMNIFKRDLEKIMKNLENKGVK